MKSNTAILLLVALIALCAPAAEAHFRLLSPPPRNPGFCGAFTTGDCPFGGFDKSRANPKTSTFRRGQSVAVTWPRNNHPAGFIKLAIIPFGSPETLDNIDKNIVQFSCHEATCKSGFPNDPLGGDNKPEDTNICSTSVTIPSYLPDGEYSLFWSIYGAGSFFGRIFQGQTDYYMMSDFTLSGGAAVDPSLRPACPKFIPGDAHNPASKGVCKFFGTGKAMSCRPDGCSGSYRDGIPVELAQCLAANPGAGNGAKPAPPAPTSSASAPAPTSLAPPAAPQPTSAAPAPKPTVSPPAPKPTSAAPAPKPKPTIPAGCPKRKTVTVTKTVTRAPRSTV
ncbi:hypothetical protein H9P43_000775 [Blastocladiella emersonii ATCC 22665]|nr:hypothetical protein H9P43_000775 [Blastocladiella emersonii ATCC 22665]